MSIANKFFFEDEYGNIRLNINDELFEVMTNENDDAYEMMLVLCTELFKELDELSNELLKHELTEEQYYLVGLVRRNHNNYVINQGKVIERIEEIEGRT